MELNHKTLGLIAIGVVVLAAVLLSRSKGTGGGSSALSVPYSVQTNTADRAQLAAIDSQTEIAKVNAKTEQLKSVLQYGLGTTQANNALQLGTLQSNNDYQLGVVNSTNNYNLGVLNSNNNVKNVDRASTAAENSALHQAHAEMAVAEQQRVLGETQARYAYESVHQQEKSKRTGSVAGTIGGIVSGVLKFL